MDIAIEIAQVNYPNKLKKTDKTEKTDVISICEKGIKEAKKLFKSEDSPQN